MKPSSLCWTVWHRRKRPLAATTHAFFPFSCSPSHTSQLRHSPPSNPQTRTRRHQHVKPLCQRNPSSGHQWVAATPPCGVHRESFLSSSPSPLTAQWTLPSFVDFNVPCFYCIVFSFNFVFIIYLWSVIWAWSIFIWEQVNVINSVFVNNAKVFKE